MEVSRERYQHGSIRKVLHAHGFAWEFRFYQTVEGKRKLKVQTFDSVAYPTETAARKAVEGQLGALNAGTLAGKVAATLGVIIDRYMREDFTTLRHSTQTTNQSLIVLHIRPKWENVRLADISALSVKTWLDKLPFGAASNARTRNIMSKLLGLAML
jgi:integrase-like protein